MTDGGDERTDDPDDELQERINGLHAQVVDQNDSMHDWFDAAIDMIDDMMGELEGVEPEAYLAGMGFARHQVRSVQLTYGDEVSCECYSPYPEQHADGAWVCGNCQTTLLTDDMPAEAREQLRGGDGGGDDA